MSVVDDVKARLDIVDVVGGYVRLQKAGRYFKANCPFHTERTPSFVVYPERQSWHCFGACGTGGDVISFVSRKENLDFSAALRLLAERAGVELRNDGPRREEAKTLQDANEAAALYYHGLLQNSTAAQAYAEERGLDKETLGAFQIGYAPSGWENLKSHLTSRGFEEAKLIEAGLLIEGERGGYDRFRERLMFPIRDDRGRVVGFGGRIIPGKISENEGPKYLNTPQTPIFDKGGILYGLDRAKEPMRRSATAVIVEGYMDVIAAHQNGFANVVASMGTALTDRQALLVQRFAERVVLAMDADEAGSAANLRGVQVVAAAAEQASHPSTGSGRTGGVGSGRAGGSFAGDGRTTRRLDVRVLALPQGKDPDELIRANPDAWTHAVEEARPVIEHLFAVVTAGRDLTQPQVRSEMVAEVLPTIGEIQDPVVQAHYLQRLSRMARVNEDVLRRQLPRRGRPVRPRGGGFAGEGTGDRAGPGVTNASGNTLNRPIKSAGEEFCLALLYTFEELGRLGSEVTEELFGLSENRELFRRWREGTRPVEEEAGIWEHYQAVLQTRMPLSETAQAERAFLDCVARLEHARMRSVKEASALALAEGSVGVGLGRVVANARAKMNAGDTEEIIDDEATETVTSLLLEDTENSRRLFESVIERSRSDQVSKRAMEEPL